MRLAALLLAVFLTGCATVKDVAYSPHTFAACTVADTASTIAAVKGGAVELNPLMANLIAHGWVPFIAFQAGLVWLMYELSAKSDAAMPIANAVKCGVSGMNLHHIATN